MNSFTKKLQFSEKIKQTIFARDNYQCLFCLMNYHMPNNTKQNIEIRFFDPMHFINKSKMGLGIEENGITGCRYHHHLLDNGNKGLRTEMLELIESRLKSLYENWNKEKLIYKKWR